MNHQSVVSSNVKSIAHDGDDLEVTFKSGKTYRYFDVPLSLFKAIEAAHSKGKYLHQNVYGKFKEREV